MLCSPYFYYFVENESLSCYSSSLSCALFLFTLPSNFLPFYAGLLACRFILFSLKEFNISEYKLYSTLSTSRFQSMVFWLSLLDECDFHLPLHLKLDYLAKDKAKVDKKLIIVDVDSISGQPDWILKKYLLMLEDKKDRLLLQIEEVVADTDLNETPMLLLITFRDRSGEICC